MPSKRMLETLLLDDDSLLLTWSISTVRQTFKRCALLLLVVVFHPIFPLHPTISTRFSAIF